MIRIRPVSLLRPLLALIVTAILLPKAAFAQFDTATVLGTVRDSTGGIIPGATVTLKNVSTGISATAVSDENGNYQFVNVHIGTYRVQAELQGFSIAEADNFLVTVNARLRVDLTLKVGNIGETVVVEGAAKLLETESSDEQRLEARIEAFNVLNKTNFGTANGNRSSSSFGAISTTFPARQIQLGLKLYF